MHIERKKDLSVYYFIKNLFEEFPSLVIHDGFPEEELTVPSIAVDANIVAPYEVELGNRNRVSMRVWHIDIFAKSKSQRDEIGYRILDALEEKIQVYNYDEGFPPDVNPSELGCLEVDNMRMDIMKINPNYVEKMYYRATVSFTATYNQF